MLVFLIMAVVLIVRPYGLLGRKPGVAQARRGGARAAALARRARREAARSRGAGWRCCWRRWCSASYGVSLLTELVILTLFAASLHFIMGPGGLASFGHAAYFGLGAYGAALAAKWLAAPMAAGLVVAPLLAGLAGVVFGWFCVRLSGVYLAMLTLAFAQIAWSVAFQWVELTGGDNGILGVWPSRLGGGQGRLLLPRPGAVRRRPCWRCALVIFSPFGYALRAGRDSPVRAEAIGLNVTRINWAAFAMAAVAAGIAGGLFAYFKGSVFPDLHGDPASRSMRC